MIEITVRSMTGYGNAKGLSGALEITVELRGVNNRFLDCTVRIPRLYVFAEERIKTYIQNRVGRGKIDVYVGVDSSKANDVTIKLNEPLLEAYIGAFGEISTKYGIRDELTNAVLSRLPDIFVVERQEIDTEGFIEAAIRVLGEALEMYEEMRRREGEKLSRDIMERLSEIERITGLISERAPESNNAYRTRLETKMREILENKIYDESRIMLEAAVFAERTAINEELVRITSHVQQIRELLRTGGASGRKLDFIVQELNRETNTIGSKCSDLDITHMVVELKSEIEKIKEQAQNIE